MSLADLEITAAEAQKLLIVPGSVTKHRPGAASCRIRSEFRLAVKSLFQGLVVSQSQLTCVKCAEICCVVKVALVKCLHLLSTTPQDFHPAKLLLASKINQNNKIIKVQ